MISAAFDADQLTPQGMIGCERFSGHQAGPFARLIAATCGASVRNNSLQAFFGEEVADQVRSPFGENHIATTHASNRLKDRSGAERASAFDDFE